ncbi:unnamed protein product [Mytilus edulis]|uniref:YqaJ viral recombinase domain-containing protein n=1 Tax=Mytilus edulis TaxID=6550 RepID=A0A8S3TUR7_MYTED|nr:unnamed protein product [Mytilus edulis]
MLDVIVSMLNVLNIVFHEEFLMIGWVFKQTCTSAVVSPSYTIYSHGNFHEAQLCKLKVKKIVLGLTHASLSYSNNLKTHISDIAPKLSKERQYQRILQLLYDIRNAKPLTVNIVDLARFRPVKQPEVKGPWSMPDTVTEFYPGVCNAESIDVETTPPSLTEITHQQFQSIDDNGYQEGLNTYINLIMKTYNQADISKIENLTRGQSANEEWFRHRIGAITASKVVRVLSNKKNQDNFLIDIMKYKPVDIFRVNPIQWGLKHEITALKQMTKLFEPKLTNLQIIQPGLLVDRTYSYLRASPDAIMTCDCHGTTVIEIKCPYYCRYLTPTVAICQKKITYVGMEKENMVLVKGHQYGYYEQIQISYLDKKRIAYDRCSI